MIGIRLEGRLGNQLFQYAFIYAAAKKLDTTYYIDQYSEYSRIINYFQDINEGSLITHLFQMKGFKSIFNFHLRRLYYRHLERRNKFPTLNYNSDAKPAAVKIQDNTLYHGYFQSEVFFNPFQDQIREKFTLKKNVKQAFQNKYNGLYKNKKIVTVHIRRTDYQNLDSLNLGGGDLSLPLEYYKKALAKFDDQIIHFVFISDDIDFVKQNFTFIINKTITSDTEIMDFQHLLNADACIISNSTFSWWGAWLNNKPGKVIYAPKYFLGWRVKKESPPNIYPSTWNLIDC